MTTETDGTATITAGMLVRRKNHDASKAARGRWFPDDFSFVVLGVDAGVAWVEDRAEHFAMIPFVPTIAIKAPGKMDRGQSFIPVDELERLPFDQTTGRYLMRDDQVSVVGVPNKNFSVVIDRGEEVWLRDDEGKNLAVNRDLLDEPLPVIKAGDEVGVEGQTLNDRPWPRYTVLDVQGEHAWVRVPGSGEPPVTKPLSELKKLDW